LSEVPTSHPAFERYDGELLFAEHLSEFFADPNALKQAREALTEEFLKTVANGCRPLPYYALLVADGDRMGSVIDQQTTIEEHRRLSRTLADFAAQVPKVVAKHEGSLVYAGGDDVLAFVPLHTVLECAQELANSFKESLRGFQDGQGRSPTLSVGVAISHHIEPLSDALQLAREAEKTAKGKGGRNALAITLSKRSGVDRTIYGAWGTLDERLQFFVRLHRREAIPDGAAYELHDLGRRLKVQDDDSSRDVLDEVMHKEAMRILKRKRARRGQEQLAQETLRRLEKYIVSEKVPLDMLADELIVARILADAADLANPPQVEEENQDGNMDH